MILTHFNAGWTFSEDHLTGVFANGEPWVVGPVTITAISPNNAGVWDETYPGDVGPNSGSTLVTVPSTFQGYCTKLKRAPGYPEGGFYYTRSLDLSLVENLPVIIAAGEILITATGQVEAGDVRTCTNEICALSVLASAPAVGSFRSNLFSPTADRTIVYNKSDIDYSFLPNLPTVTGAPSKAYIMSLLPALPWFEYDNTPAQSSYGPANNFATDGGGVRYPSPSSVYGREIAGKAGQVALWLCLDNTDAEKESVMVAAVQIGLDIASFLQNGGVFYSDGGHKVGRMFFVWLAGKALNDAAILALLTETDPPLFSETQSCWQITSEDVGRPVAQTTYLTEDIGIYEWGIKHSTNPFQDNRNWETNYRTVTWGISGGAALAIHLCGGKADFGDNQAVFGYTERFHNYLGELGIPWWDALWTAYYDAAVVNPPVISVSGTSRRRSEYTLDGPRTITLSANGFADGFYYTTNGTDATHASTLYTAPFVVSASATIKAISYKAGYDDSGQSSVTVTILSNGKPAAPYNLTARIP